MYFAHLLIGERAYSTGQVLQCVSPKSPRVSYPIISQYLHYSHRICFWIIAGLTARDHLYAHTRMATGTNAGPTGRFVDAPVQIGGGGSTDGPYGRVSSNPNRNTWWDSEANPLVKKIQLAPK